MGNSEKEIPLSSDLSELLKIFKEKGYPKESFLKTKELNFSYKSLSYNIFIPLLIKNNSHILLIVDYKPQENLFVSERGVVALARVLFEPIPYFVLITNLKEFILIDVYTGEKKKGNKEIIPDFIFLKNHKPSITKSFNYEIEKKILAIYLSGG